MLQSQNLKPGSALIRRVKQIFNYLMVCVYGGLSLFELIKGLPGQPRYQSILIGSLLFCYAMFRVFRIIRDAKKPDESED